jgi:hypothetical protein
LAALETFQALVFPKLVPQNLFSSILHLVLKLQLVLFPHLHFHSFSLLLSLLIMIRSLLVLPVIAVLLLIVHFARLALIVLRFDVFVGQLQALDGAEYVLVFGLSIWL